MSRFFETLKEASRSQPNPEPAPDVRPADQAMAATAAFVFPPLAEVPVPETEPADPAFTQDELPATRNGFRVQTISFHLDKKVPLIPHTVDNSIVEQYRRLRTKIQQQHTQLPIASILVASPGPGEGKTLTAINLGLSFAMLSTMRVLVVDGDLRKGTVGKWLGVDDLPGFSNVIEGSATLEEVIFKAEELPVHFMFRGTSKKNSAELLNSRVLPQAMDRLKRDFDLVIVDSPPVNLIADAQMLAGSCDGVLLVARAFKTSNKAFQRMLKDLQPFRIVGTVLNGGMRAQLYHNYYGNY
jgi:capsular exopolysaccharide synthesis family protein